MSHKRNTTDLYHATRNPDRSIENEQRAARVLAYLCDRTQGTLYKDIRQDLGLSYAQTIRALGLLCAMEFVTVKSIALWNGQNYVYPHYVEINTPVPVIRG